MKNSEQKNWLDNDKAVKLYVKKLEKASKYVYRPLAKEIIKLIRKNEFEKEIKIIDIGCGPGFLLFEIKKINQEIKVIGIDPSKKMIEIAQKKAMENNIREIDLKIEYAEEISLFDGEIDVAICQSSLSEWKNIEKGLNEIFRILKKEGFVIINDFNGEYPKWKMKWRYLIMILLAGLRSAKEHFKSKSKWQNPQKIKDFMEEIGFQVDIIKNKFKYQIIGQKIL